MRHSKLLFWSLEILIILAIIYFGSQVSFLFEPIIIFFSTLFFPIVIAGFLYFILNPVVDFLEKLKFPRSLAILTIFLVFIGLIVLVIAIGAPVLGQQIKELISDIPKYFDQLQQFFNEFSDTAAFQWILTQQYVSLESIEQWVMDALVKLPDAFSAGIFGLVSIVANIALVIGTVPFLLFFMLKDGHKLPGAIVRFLPPAYRNEGLKILKDMSNTLQTYIQGQFIVALCVGTLSYIGYIIIDLPYALILALIVALTNIIPYLGPILGTAPAVIIALFKSPILALLTIAVAVVAQQTESNLISPLVIGNKLQMHPVTIIIILLVAGNIAGVVGLILGVPFYAVTKVIVLNIVRMIKLHRDALELEKEQQTTGSAK